MSDKSTVSGPTLASIFGLTEVRVQQLAKIGVVTKTAHGKYDLWSSIKGYIRYLQERAGTRGVPDSEGSAGDDYEKERARLYKARADMAEVEAAIVKGKAHEAEAVAAVWSDMVGNARSRLLSLPAKAAAMVHGEESLLKVRTTLEDCVREALNELANYDPARVTERFVQEHRETLDAAAEADGKPVGGQSEEAE